MSLLDELKRSVERVDYFRCNQCGTVFPFYPLRAGNPYVQCRLCNGLSVSNPLHAIVAEPSDGMIRFGSCAEPSTDDSAPRRD